MESENTAGAEQPTTDEQPGINHLAELMTDDSAGAPDDAAAEPVAKPSKFNDLAGALGMELDDLYKLEIAQADDGTPVTIENLKDRHSKQADFSLREIEFEERRTLEESKMLQAREELRELLAALPEKAVKPEVLQRVRDKQDAELILERRRTMEVIPDWQDDATRTKDFEGMAAHMQQYGYPADYLKRIADHRQIKYIRDNWQREQRIRKALDKVKAGTPNPTSKQKPANKAPSKSPLTGVKRGQARNKLEAVFSDIK